MASVAQAVLRGSRDWHCPRPTVYKSGTLVLLPGRAFFCQSPVASTWPLAGLSRDHFIPHLLILQSATLLNKVLLTCNAGEIFGSQFRYDFHRLMIDNIICKIIHDIMFLKLWYHSSESMISVLRDIIDIWYHIQYHMRNHIWYHVFETMIS